MRGNQPRACANHVLVGSIPACAGEPRGEPYCSAIHQVYPRVCGGTFREDGSSDSWTGLSPRVRGNQVEDVRAYVLDGSIPACAGEPRAQLYLGRCHWVYPRVCGGTSDNALIAQALAGLSPRVRGNPHKAMSRSWSTRSIPACAGEPPCLTIDGKPKRVYPRVCGGTHLDVSGGKTASGLSPRVRGNRPLQVWGHVDGRSIPACAGEPHLWSIQTRRLRVYPRVCGGTFATVLALRVAVGLSPRVRGNRHR